MSQQATSPQSGADTRVFHLLEARHEWKLRKHFGDELQGCGINQGETVSVWPATRIDDVTCKTCLHWYWHEEGLDVAPHVHAEIERGFASAKR